MKISLCLITSLVCSVLSPLASASQATDTTIAISGQTPGPRPFISKLTLSVSNLPAVQRIKFAITPKPGSVTRPLSATYAKGYLKGRGYVDSANGNIVVPVFGLYEGYTNTVVLTYFFADGSFKQASTMIATEPYNDACSMKAPNVRQARTKGELSYDFILVASDCRPGSPIVIDTDGAVRWVGTGDVGLHYTTFFQNGVYVVKAQTKLLRIELDGEVKELRDYADIGIGNFHHNIDPGKFGIILETNPTGHLEVDRAGNVLKRWNLADIISDAMKADGDDPSGFVRRNTDWAHENAATYRKSDNSVIFSSRENFVLCLDYDTNAIKWILGDTSKQWYQYPSLKKFALAVAPGGIAPTGQHAVSITKDDHLLLFDNGTRSLHHEPAGPSRSYSAARKYHLDLEAKIATEVAHYPFDQSVRSAYRSSVYEDAAGNYLLDYADAVYNGGPRRAEILGLDVNGAKVFDYSYPWATQYGKVGYRSIPVHWENLVFPFVP